MAVRRVYMDNSATTRVNPKVVEAMLPYFTEEYGNPSSLHNAGRAARKGLEAAREKIASILGCQPKEMVLLSGGTEGDNLAIAGAARANRKKGTHIITSQIEHHAILNACSELEKEGFKTTYLPVDAQGVVKLDELEKAVTGETVLVSIMHANNEVGTVQPIEEICDIAHKHGVLVHTDAVQSVGKVRINLKDFKVDMLTMSAHKIHGPKGIGGLFIRAGTRMQPLQFGGHHEFRKRAGTENVPGAAGFAAAMELAYSGFDAHTAKLRALRDRLQAGIVKAVPEVQVNGHPEKRLPNITNISFKYIEGEGIILSLDALGVCVSSGSACTSDSLEPSHVLSAMCVPVETAHGSIRFSLGLDNTDEDVDFVLQNIPQMIQRLREMSPLYHKSK
jgi:cysteine desulfurase